MADVAEGSVILETDIDTNGVEAGSEEMESRLDGMAQTVDRQCQRIEQAVSDAVSTLHDMGTAAQSASSQASESTTDYGRAVEETREKIAQLKAELEKEQAAEAEIARIRRDKQAEGQDFITKNGYGGMPQAFQEQVLKDFNDQAEEAIQNLGLIYDADAFKAKQEEVKALEQELERLIAKQQEYAEQSLQQAREEAAAEQSSGTTENAHQEEEVEPVKPQQVAYAQELKNLMGTLAKAIQNAAMRALEFAKNLSVNIIKGFASALQSAATHAATLARNLGKLAFGTITKGINKATTALKKFTTTASKTSLDANALVKSLTGIKRILITRIKRTFISSLFKDVGEGINRLAKFDSAFNKTMSNITNTATRLKGDIAVTVGNILTTLEPIITKLLNLLDKAFTSINQLFSAFSGKKTYTAAKQGTDDYAKSVDSATKKQKKLNAELYGFDELTRQQQKDTDDDTSGIQYETKAIDLPQGILDWVEKLKQLWKAGDWYNFGATIAEGLNAALKTVDDWINNKFHPWAVKWATRIGTIINGLVDAFDWELLGKTIADGMNAIFDAMEHFLDTVDWTRLGEGIGRAIKSWFENVDIQMIGRVFAKKFMALIRIIKGIVTTPGIWKDIGKAIADFIRGWFEGIDFDDIADTIIAVLQGIPEAIEEFLGGDPFEGVPERIFNALNRVIHEVEWEYLIGELADLLIYLVDQIRQILAGINWDEVFDTLRNMGVTFATKIIEYLGSIDWGLVTSTLANGFNQLIGMINDIISQPGFWEGVGTTIANAVLGWFGSISYDDIATLLINLINGATTALETFLANDGFAGVAASITSAIQRVINEVRWADLLNALGMAFKDILNGILDTVKLFNWNEIGQNIGKFLAELPWGDIFATVANALFNGFKGMLGGLFSTGDGRILIALGAAILGMKTGILGAVAKLGAALLLKGKIASYITANIVTPITSALGSSLPGAISGAAGPIGSALTALGSAVSPVAAAAVGIAAAAAVAYTTKLAVDNVNAMKEMGEALNSEVQTAMDSMVKCYESGGAETVQKWMEMAYGVKSTGEGMEADLRALAERIAELQGTSADEIYAQFTQNADLMKMKAEESGSAIAQSVETSSGKVTEAAQGMTENIGIAAQELDEKITQPVDEMSQSVSASAESMNTNASGSTNEMGENMKGTWNDVDSTWKEKLASIESALTTSMQNMVAITAQGATDQTQPFFDHWGDVMDFIGLVLQSIEEKLTLSLETMATTIDTAMIAVSDRIQTGLDSLQQVIDTFLTTISMNIQSSMDGNKQTIDTVLTTITQSVQTNLDGMLSITDTSLTSAESTVTSKMETISDEISAAMDKISTTFEQKWEQIVTKFETVMKSMETKAKASMENLKKITLGAIEAIKQQPWNSIGEAIVNGIGQGVQNRWPWLEDLVRQRAQQLLQAAKNQLGIASPSKLFASEVGENIGLGWAQGIEDTEGDVLKTVSNISDAITREAQGTDIDANAKGVLDVGMQTVLSGLSDVAETFLAIANTLKSIGGFTMPQIAAGTIAPYKTKAAAEAAPSDDTDMTETHLSGIETALQRLIELMQDNGNAQQDIKVIIDGREVFAAVVNENNRAINRTGASPIRV